MKQEEWNEHFERQEKSGMTITGYCRRNRISIGNWYRYQKIRNENRSKSSFREVKVARDPVKEPEFQVSFVDGFYSLKIEALSKPELRKILSSFI